MEERFKEIGTKYAEEVAAQYHIENDDALKERCAQYKWNLFVADCSDDFSRTILEREEENARFRDYINRAPMA